MLKFNSLPYLLLLFTISQNAVPAEQPGTRSLSGESGETAVDSLRETGTNAFTTEDSSRGVLPKRPGPLVGPEALNVDIESFVSYDDCMRAGIEYFEQASYFTALPLFKRALQIKPNDATANYHIGCTYLETNDLAKAKLYLKTAIAIKAEFDMAYLRLGDVFSREGNLKSAWEQYKKAHDLNSELLPENRMDFSDLGNGK